jgi:methionyl-tRNA formyltransferase
VRIAYIGGDSFANCAMALLDQGHEITHLFTSGETSFAPVTMSDVARRAGVRLRRQRVSPADIRSVVAEGAEVILCAIYRWRLPVVGCGIPAVNVHPSPLPEGRGPSPYQWAILSERTDSGVTVHEMVERFDAGPILWQRRFELAPGETVASLEHRSGAVAEEAVTEVFADFERAWANRTPQGPDTYCRVPRRSDRTLDWAGNTEALDKRIRAFRTGQWFGQIDGALRRLNAAECWAQPHAYPPGFIAQKHRRQRIIATADGYARVEIAGWGFEQRLRVLAWPMVRRLRPR